ncbi:hypothetical protein EWM64_g8524 [Hericium alpestre]|uniref:Uncharacterized protein n=1 Tax=Hericium alpestre TaxID=135208 RepID=A0A4Y9ZML7_9AGAM|nr:hypothetical protein EWM64_g8524 [Hericium alpestre]
MPLTYSEMLKQGHQQEPIAAEDSNSDSESDEVELVEDPEDIADLLHAITTKSNPAASSVSGVVTVLSDQARCFIVNHHALLVSLWKIPSVSMKTVLEQSKFAFNIDMALATLPSVKLVVNQKVMIGHAGTFKTTHPATVVSLQLPSSSTTEDPLFIFPGEIMAKRCYFIKDKGRAGR